MIVKNLEFFDKNGYNLNLNWNEQKKIWEGNIFFPKVSVGLYENTTIYVTEYVGQFQFVDCDSDYTDDIYTYPTGSGNIVFQWDLANTFVDEFFMFNFDADYELKDTSSLIYTPYDGPACEMLAINRFDKYIVPLFESSEYLEKDDLMEIHVAFRADEKSAETTYKRTLVMSYEEGYKKYEIARITFFAETIEEDERLKIWNENLGYNLKPEDSIIFKQSDMHEYMPNFELLNEKRKELMLEGNNIYPYIGGYKAIMNAIKFFGYDNLNIVEYWRNINEYDSDFGKIYRTYVYSLKDRKTLSTKRKPIPLNTKNFQKLNNISLVYNINHPESANVKKYDEYGLPNVVEDFDKDKKDDFVLTIEEALVKLFALKKKLNDEFMPGSTKITDIIGEGNYFGINLIGNNPQISTVNYVESKGYIDFSVFPDKYCYITENEDFARYIAEKLEKSADESIGEIGDKTIAELESLYNNNGDSDNSTIQLGNIINTLMEKENDYVCNIYKEYYDITCGNKFGDAKEYGLKEIAEARNVYKDIILDDFVDDSYGENDIVPDMAIFAKVVLKGSFNENIDITSIIEWKITHPEKGWSVTYSGDIKTYGNVFVQLPYLGNYDVEMTVWDLYNHCCKQYTKDAIIVEPYNIDIRGFYYDARPLPNDLKYDLFIPQEYQDKYYLWKINDAYTNGAYVEKRIVTRKRYPLEMDLSDIIGEYIIDGDDLEEYIGIENIRDVNREHWVSIVNKKEDGNDILKFSWKRIDYEMEGVDTFEFVSDLNLSIDLFEKKEYEYHLWTKDEGNVLKGIVTRKRYPSDITLSDIFGECLIYKDDECSDSLYEYIGLENIRDVDKENWISIVNTEEDGNNVLKFSWMCVDNNSITHYGIDEYKYEEKLTDVPFDENDSYNPEWNKDALYHVIKNNVDNMYSWALQEHLYEDCENTSMRNYRPDGTVNFEGPYYKFDVDNIIYKAERGYKEYDHLNSEIVNLEPGEHYKYVRYINNTVDIKPLTWVLLGFDYSRITGRIIGNVIDSESDSEYNEYPKWTITLIGDKLDPDEEFRNDKVLATHNGLYLTYLFEYEGTYKVKLELMDINGNKYEIEKSIIIVDKDANYGLYHTLNDEYNKYLEAKNERNLQYIFKQI